MNNSPKITAEAAVRLTREQQQELAEMITFWQSGKGIVIASLGRLNDEPINITFRQVPIEIAEKVIQIVEDYYAGEETK